MKNMITRLGALLAYIVMVGTNYLAVSLPLAGRDTGAISDSYPNLFAPAGYAFSIWGLIYLLLGAYVIYQFRAQNNGIITKVSRIFIINALLNAAWIFAWHYDYIGLSLLIMIGLLFTLIKIADILRSSALDKAERWLARLPFSVYFGWITVATIANATVFLVSIAWRGWGIPESSWMVLVLLAGLAIGGWRLLRDRALSYGAVLVWAYGAILYKHLSGAGFNQQYPEVIITVSACLLVFSGLIAWLGLKKLRSA